MTRVLEISAAGLIAGTVPTTGRSRVEALDEAAEERGDATGDLGLGALAVREAGTVGGVDDRRVRQQRARRAEDGQSPDAGIEEEYGGVRVHGRSVARLGSSRKLRLRSGLLLTRR
jgi:hypothetical protein